MKLFLILSIYLNVASALVAAMSTENSVDAEVCIPLNFHIAKRLQSAYVKRQWLLEI
jgi:hypothetical protein